MKENNKVNVVLIMVTTLVVMSIALLFMGVWIIRDVGVLADTAHFDISTPIVE